MEKDQPTDAGAESAPTKVAQATLGGGCFWCTEAVFSEVRGVTHVEPGYGGGSAENPSYEDVCTGRTGHAEVIQLDFAPATISYRDILRIFFTVHDPTTRNRQGADVGTQYRSIILYHGPTQRAEASAVIEEIRGARIWRGEIVTELQPFTRFYPAEEYHHRYFARNPGQGYCQAVIEPKVAAFRRKFAPYLRSDSTAPEVVPSPAVSRR